MPESILILGGDGYIGWPAAMHFSNLGYDVTIVDNCFRRGLEENSDIGFLYKTPSLVERAIKWKEFTGKQINVIIGDLRNATLLRKILSNKKIFLDWPRMKVAIKKPKTIIHYAEQPSATYSQLSSETSLFTLVNNLSVTNNLLFAVKDFCPETHIIKLGTMGEYGTPNIDIEEGWLEISHKGRSDKFLFPRQAGSIYHTSKIMDTDLIWFAVRTWGLKVTDLMQGPVYGLETKETKINEAFKTFFNYDEFFGTVINRFIVQTIIGHPMTIYGTGNQKRGYISLQDSINCSEISLKNPPSSGELKIYNQISETFSVNDIANLILDSALKKGYRASIKYMKNPRVEAENHYYNPHYSSLVDLGFQPQLLDQSVIQSMLDICEKYKKNIKKEVFFKGVKW